MLGLSCSTFACTHGKSELSRDRLQVDATLLGGNAILEERQSRKHDRRSPLYGSEGDKEGDGQRNVCHGRRRKVWLGQLGRVERVQSNSERRSRWILNSIRWMIGSQWRAQRTWGSFRQTPDIIRPTELATHWIFPRRDAGEPTSSQSSCESTKAWTSRQIAEQERNFLILAI